MDGWTALIGGSWQQRQCSESRRRVAQFGLAEDRRLVLRRRLLATSELYISRLTGHTSCINALDVAGSGQWVLSGGDDRRVLLWQVDQCVVDKYQMPPVVMNELHNSNIFAVQFSCDEKQVFSGGNDHTVCSHDMQTAQLTNCFIRYSPIYGFSAHPLQSQLLAVCFQAGQVRQYDMRSMNDSVLLTRLQGEANSVQHHPLCPELLIVAGSAGLELIDIRKAGRPLYRFGHKDAFHSRFCRRGQRLLTVYRRRAVEVRLLKQLDRCFLLDDPTYFSSVSKKNCCFAGDADQLAVVGADDFNVYAWHLPSDLELLINNGEENSALCKAKLILRGHDSVVNQVHCVPHSQMLISAGVESQLCVWSLWPLREAAERGEFSPRALTSLQHGLGRNAQPLNYFDALIQLDVCSERNEDADDDDDDDDKKTAQRVQPLFELLHATQVDLASASEMEIIESLMAVRMRRAVLNSMYTDHAQTHHYDLSSLLGDVDALPNANFPVAQLQPVNITMLTTAGRLLHQRGALPAGATIPAHIIDALRGYSCPLVCRLFILLLMCGVEPHKLNNLRVLRICAFLLYTSLEECCTMMQSLDWDRVKLFNQRNQQKVCGNHKLQHFLALKKRVVEEEQVEDFLSKRDSQTSDHHQTL